MNRLYTLIGVLLVAATAIAQPSWTKKATKAVFTLKTFDAQGTLLSGGTGFFTTTDGVAVSALAPFKGASSAVVIDAQGKEWPVECMLGANDTYDVARFRVTAKKTTPLTIANNAAEGSAVWLLPYRETKQCPEGTIRKTETFANEYGYYTVALSMGNNVVGSPLLNAEGEVVGLMQQPSSATDTLNYAVSARYADSLRISGLSLSDPALRSTNIKKDLPETLDQAQLMLFLASSRKDSTVFANLL